MKDQFHPVRDDDECERMIRDTYQGVLAMSRRFREFMAYYGHDDYPHGEELLEKTNVIVIDVERMTARREYDEFRTDYWTWGKVETGG